MDEMLRCDLCGDLIGVYEPMVAILEGLPYETSLAARENLTALPSPCYHRACFEQSQTFEQSHALQRT